MTFETYWLAVPLIGIGLSAFGWLALWMTRGRAVQDSGHPVKP
jgi:hypothetical protein